MKATIELINRSHHDDDCRCEQHFDRRMPKQIQSSRSGYDGSRILVESSDYEWMSLISLPGLVVVPDGCAMQETVARRAIDQTSGEILDTEDGDASAPTQLPGRLSTQNGTPIELDFVSVSRDQHDKPDEYLELTAIQLPGRLIDGSDAFRE